LFQSGWKRAVVCREKVFWFGFIALKIVCGRPKERIIWQPASARMVAESVGLSPYRVWKRSGFSSVSECCGVLLSHWRKKLMISCLRGVAQLIHTRAEEGGFGTADESERKWKNLRTRYREPCRLLRTRRWIRLS
jgi:hypothetical protein